MKVTEEERNKLVDEEYDKLLNEMLERVSKNKEIPPHTKFILTTRFHTNANLALASSRADERIKEMEIL